MTRIEFDQLVEDLRKRFEGRTIALTRSALAWAVLGYIALVSGFLASLGVVAACILMVAAAPNALTIKLGLVFGITGALIAWSILRGAWVRCPPPEGEAIVSGDAPRLFQLMEETGKAAGGIPLDRVLITPDLNACVAQTPRLGIFGWHRNDLCLGIQLLDLTEPDEFRAVLAHEFAHLSKSHGRTGNWLYRIRNSWESVAESLAAQGGILVRPLGTFFRWFWPRFNARAFLLSRANEYEADAFAARLTSPATTVTALARISLESHRLQEEIWAKMERRTAEEPEPPDALFSEIAALARREIEPATAKRWLDQQYARVTDTSDTHPSLKDRVTALGGAADAPPPPISGSASDQFLGAGLAERLRARFSGDWRREHFKLWLESSEQARSNRKQLENLATGTDGEPAPWDALSLRIRVDGVAAVHHELAGFVQSHPDHHEARFVLGSHLLSIDDPTGVEMIQQVAADVPFHAIDCFGLLAAYHDRHGNADAIRGLKHQADQHEVMMERALRERHVLTKHDRFLPHGLTEDDLAKARMFLDAIPEVASAWLVRKEVGEFPAWKSYAIIVRLKFRPFRFVSQKTIETLLQRILEGISLDGYVVIMQDKSEVKPIAKNIRAVDGSDIFSRPA